jgi:hypothetical protein
MLAAQKFDRRALQFTVKAATLPSTCPSSFFYPSIRFCPRFCISALFINICSFVLAQESFNSKVTKGAGAAGDVSKALLPRPRDPR